MLRRVPIAAAPIYWVLLKQPDKQKVAKQRGQREQQGEDLEYAYDGLARKTKRKSYANAPRNTAFPSWK
jgi:hypothetical protein